MGRAADWVFTKRFRRGGFGWRAGRLASERIAAALAEIHAVARHDPLHAADGAVRFLVKLSPALEQVDSSSGALGGAARAAVDSLVPLIAQVPADEEMREKWLEQLFEAIQNDDPPYLEPLDERWGLVETVYRCQRYDQHWRKRGNDRVSGATLEIHCGAHEVRPIDGRIAKPVFKRARVEQQRRLVAGSP